MLEMTVDSIRVSLMNYQRVVILKGPSETESDRRLLKRERGSGIGGWIFGFP